MLSLHPLLADRSSTRAFDPAGEVTSEQLATLLEAARWAPSSFNSQPWRFAVGRRDDETHKRIFATLTTQNQRWAGRAPLLLVGAHLTQTDGRPLPHAGYDLGQAVAHLTVQATAMNLYVRQMAGFSAQSLHDELGLADDVRVVVVLAVGPAGGAESLPEDLQEREQASRERLPAGSLLLT